MALVGCGTAPAPRVAGESERETLSATIIEDEPFTYDDFSITASPMDGASDTWAFSISSAQDVRESGLEFIWDFGDGQSYAGPEQSYVFSEPGIHRVTVTVVDRRGVTVAVLSLQVEVPSPNQPPIANAGPDVFVEEDTAVLLNGNGSFDPEEAPLTYEWRQVAGPPVGLLDADHSSAHFRSPVVGSDSELTFILTVDDGELIDEDQVTVYVADLVDTASFDPEANAGPDQTVTELSIVTLDGSQSSGAGASALAFEWFQVSGPPVSLDAPTAAVTTFQAPASGGVGVVLAFELVVSEGEIAASDEVVITVEPEVIEDDDDGGDPPPPPTLCQTDGDCDDGNGCNGEESCQAGSCVAGVAVECDDGLFCNGQEICVGGVCQAGTGVDCDDGVDCTDDACDENAGACMHVPDDGACDNGLFCDGEETCHQTQGCVAGAAIDCNDGVACTVDSCNESTASCVHAPDDGACDNGLFCDGTESCHATLGCRPGTAVNCSDGVACTADSCNEATDSCAHVPNNAACDNGLFCDGAETCHATLGCRNGSAVDCSDGVACTVDSCNEVTDSCSHAPDDGACDNGLFCDGDETCHAVLGCQTGPAPCTAQLCHENTDSCEAIDCTIDDDCDDGVYCNGAERCISNSCQAGVSIDCDDGVDCTVDSCNEITETCDNVATDALCDNGLFCDGAEFCHPIAGCQSGTPVDCDDGVDCTDDVCNEATDSCEHDADDSFCDNGLFCDGAESCHQTLDCRAGIAVNCNDGVGCTVDSCNEATNSCTHAPNNAACDNGQFCDGTETCHATQGCLAGTAVNCNDGVACTVDSCNEATDSCAHALNHSACSNGLFCDGTETCHATLGCQPGSDPCGGDSCDEIGDSCVSPALAADAGALDFGSTIQELQFEVWNSGGGTLTYTAVPDAGASWLTVAPGSGSSNGEHDTLTASVDRTGFAEGNYEAGITVTPSAGSIVIISVTMAVQAAAPGLNENFEGYGCGANAANWFDTGANNSLTQNDALFSVQCPSGNKALSTSSTSANIHSHYTGSGSDQMSSYTLAGRMMISQATGGVGVTFLSDYPNTDTYYRLRRGDFSGGNSFHISPHGTSITSGTADTGIIPAANQWYRFLIEVTDTGSRTEIKAKVWSNGSGEPGSWQINCYDSRSSRLTHGTVGVWSMGDGAKYWDDLVVQGLNCDVDSDGDGTVDCQDGCPNDPNKTTPGVCGCGTPETDSDGDGVANCVDQCPGAPDTDADGDGTANCVDGCPNDPDKTAPGACGCGQPDTDANSNGTADCLDPATLCVSPTSLNFGSSTTSLSFEVWNCGGGSLSYSITDNAAWLSASPTSGSSTGERDTITAAVNRTGLADNTYNAAITVNPSTGADVAVSVSMSVGVPDGEPMATANRTTGVAPLSVFFDAVDPASGVVQPSDGDYAKLHYEWDFGDPSAGVWSTSGKSKNRTTGYVTAHVFEEPGAHLVTLRVTRPDGTTSDYQQQVQVSDPSIDPSWTTYYVSSSLGNDTNSGLRDGSGTVRAFATFAKAIAMAGPKTRILFRRGDSWTINNGISLQTGPGIIGAWYSSDGTDNSAIAKPRINHTGSTPVFTILSGELHWRIMDLDLHGDPAVSAAPAIGLGSSSASHTGLVLRCDVARFSSGVMNGNPTLTHSFFVVDSTFSEIGSSQANGNGAWFGGRRQAFMGNTVTALTLRGEHNLRMFHSYKVLISHNILLDPAPTKICIKLHNAESMSPPDSQYIIIADNRVRPHHWAITIAPQNTTSDERVRDVIVERNVILRTASGLGSLGVLIRASDITIRNNLADATNNAASNFTFVSVEDPSSSPLTPTGVTIYNNTVYRGDAGKGVAILGWTDTVIRNNSLCAIAGTARLNGAGIASHNLLESVHAFLSTDPQSADFLRPNPDSSSAIDAGTLVPVRDDFDGSPRPMDGDNASGAAYDVGAYETAP